MTIVKGRPIVVEENGRRYLAIETAEDQIPTALEATISDDGTVQLWQYGYAPDPEPTAANVDIPRMAAAFTSVLTDDSENEPPDVRVPGDDFGS